MTTRFVEQLFEPKRREDRVEELLDKLAFSAKVSDGLLSTIDRQDALIASLQGELAELRANSLVLMGMRK